MMNETPFQTFIALIDFDQNITQLQKQFDRIEQDIARVKSKEVALVQEKEVAYHLMYELKKEVSQIERSVKELDIKEKEKKTLLQNITNQKEYKSVKRELDRLHQQQHILEQDLISVWKKFEASEKNYEQKAQTVDENLKSVQAEIAQKSVQRQEVYTQINVQNELRPAQTKNVPTEWLDKYVVMRSQVSDPVVPVNQGSCSACFYQITQQDLQQLRRNKLLQCRDCYRFLYDAEMKEGDTPPEQTS